MKQQGRRALCAFLLLVLLLCVPITAMSIEEAASIELASAKVFDGRGYKLYDGMGMDWNEAQAFCESVGGHLVTITSAQEQLFVRSLVETEGTQNHYWLGGKRNADRVLSWVTQEPMEYTNWASGQPDNSDNSENCIMMYRVPDAAGHDLGRWNDINESGRVGYHNAFGKQNFGFICEWGNCCVSEDRVQLNHNYGAWSVTQAADCLTDGAQVRVCQSCGQEESAVVDALGHRYGEVTVLSGNVLIPPIRKERVCIRCAHVEQIEDWSYVWVTVLAGVAAIAVFIGVIGYVKAFRKRG